ncbi:hypothetical protein DUT91_23920 [Phyllobacterium salinisoli]|uniref:Uncharacterized protein n=1 Tax=Phyllobacterium salinisoli TaxID=1899321 RepID=A0A368JWC2_9HYPH|nr:hypothetical protein [Phyllobacterium salinisoli]RCS21469.1 hypothetical protein DUT91_23920 [Phyllobacterium salinisoli]
MRRKIMSACLGMAVLIGGFDVAHAVDITFENNTRDPFDLTLFSQAPCVTNPGPSQFTVASREKYVLKVGITLDCYNDGGTSLSWHFNQKRHRFSGWFSNAYLKALIIYNETVTQLGSPSTTQIKIIPSELPDQGDKREWFRASCAGLSVPCLNTPLPNRGEHGGKIMVPTVSGEFSTINGGIYGK